MAGLAAQGALEQVARPGTADHLDFISLLRTPHGLLWRVPSRRGQWKSPATGDTGSCGGTWGWGASAAMSPHTIWILLSLIGFYPQGAGPGPTAGAGTGTGHSG